MRHGSSLWKGGNSPAHASVKEGKLRHRGRGWPCPWSLRKCLCRATASLSSSFAAWPLSVLICGMSSAPPGCVGPGHQQVPGGVLGAQGAPASDLEHLPGPRGRGEGRGRSQPHPTPPHALHPAPRTPPRPAHSTALHPAPGPGLLETVWFASGPGG